MLPTSSSPSASASGPTLQERKTALRQEALARRAAMGAEGRASASSAAAGQAPLLLSSVAGRVVSLFAPFRDEIDTAPLAALLWSAGAQVALPVVVARDAPLAFRLWRPGDRLEPQGPFRIPTPGPDAPERVPDDLMVPFAAFDRRGFRIGYGAGFYDRTLSLLRARRAVRAFGYGFSCQEVPEVPAEPHDEPVDGVITETAAFLCGG
jgi:5-formyltetrahydrofolate cyclo-ligase